MTCDVCKKFKTGLAWVSSPSGSYVLCTDCAQPQQRELHDLIARFAHCHTFDSLLHELLDAAMDVTNADMGNVQIMDEHRVLRIRAQIGFAPEFLDFFNGVHENEAACGTAAANRKTIAVQDVETSPIFVGTEALTILRNAGVQAVQSTPIFSTTGTLVGIVSTHFLTPHAFSNKELELVGHLAAHAAGVAERFEVVES